MFFYSVHTVLKDKPEINPLPGRFIFCGLNSIQTYFRTVQTHRVELDRAEPWVKPTLVLCLNDPPCGALASSLHEKIIQTNKLLRNIRSENKALTSNLLCTKLSQEVWTGLYSGLPHSYVNSVTYLFVLPWWPTNRRKKNALSGRN